MCKPLVSVIVPVYRTEKYLQACVDSILRQRYENLEMILVDDGSPDTCPELCDALAENHENIRVIHQENQGLGLARNTGLAAAEGTYVLFVDSDDCLDGLQAVSCLVEEAEKSHADIVQGCYRRFCQDWYSAVNHHHLHPGEYTRSVDFRFKGFYMYGHLSYAWGKLYRRAFLMEHQLWCKAYPFTQDKAHNIACCAYEPVYGFVDQSLYLYRKNEASVTGRYKENFISVWTSIASDFVEFLKERQISGSYGDLTAFHLFFGSFFLVEQELLHQKHGIVQAVEKLRVYGKNPLVKKSMAELSRGQWVSQISPISWKVVIPLAALLFHLHGYWLFAVGIALLKKLEIDRRITKARYSGKGGTYAG